MKCQLWMKVKMMKHFVPQFFIGSILWMFLFDKEDLACTLDINNEHIHEIESKNINIV